MINNDFFFSEVKIVANYAIKYGDPVNEGVEQGIKYLRQKRHSHNPVKFKEENFNKYAERYTTLARAMVQAYIDCSKDLDE